MLIMSILIAAIWNHPMGDEGLRDFQRPVTSFFVGEGI
jgi:hypothetical protein